MLFIGPAGGRHYIDLPQVSRPGVDANKNLRGSVQRELKIRLFLFYLSNILQ
jgi:hypothetical protein